MFDCLAPISLDKVMEDMEPQAREDFEQIMGLALGISFAVAAVFSTLYITLCVFIYAAVYTFYQELKYDTSTNSLIFGKLLISVFISYCREGQEGEDGVGNPGKQQFVSLENA